MDSYEKKYKEIVGKIRKAYLCAITDSTKAVLEEILPELTESKDEKTRKSILALVRQSSEVLGAQNQNNMIAWLEKQGEQKPTDIDKSRLKIGDWIIENGVNRNPVQITSFEEAKGLGIKVWFNNGTGTFIDFLEGYHKWTIQDAKDGDVLATDDGNICVFDGTVEDGKYPFAYYGLTRCRFEPYDRRLPFTHDNVHPATKEQRDLLFAKVKEAGYEWDAEKKELKELKKIEQKHINKVEPKFKVGDWITNNLCSFKISSIDAENYWANEDTVGGNIESINNQYHLWTIQDAKDGDVLAIEDKNFVTPFVAIYKSLGDIIYNGLRGDNTTFNSHCFIAFNGKFYAGEEEHDTENIHPATKEQHDLLFQEMKEAGYEWNAEKKELKELKKLAWSALDERNLEGIIDEIKANKNQAPQYDLETYDRFISWLNSIKDRYTCKASNE